MTVRSSPLVQTVLQMEVADREIPRGWRFDARRGVFVVPAEPDAPDA